MNKLPLISSPISEVWPSWLMLGLLLCIVMAEVLQPETICMSFRTTFSRMERMFGDSAVNFWGAVALTVFRVSVIALTLYLVCYDQGTFSIITYGWIVLIVIAFVIIKSIFAWLLSYTFDLKRDTTLYLPQYSNLWTAFCIVLYPILLITINIGHTNIIRWLILAIAGLFCIDVIIKLVQHFYKDLSSIAFIVLYTLTLEIIPITAMIIGVRQLT